MVSDAAHVGANTSTDSTGPRLPPNIQLVDLKQIELLARTLTSSIQALQEAAQQLQRISSTHQRTDHSTAPYAPPASSPNGGDDQEQEDSRRGHLAEGEQELNRLLGFVGKHQSEEIFGKGTAVSLYRADRARLQAHPIRKRNTRTWKPGQHDKLASGRGRRSKTTLAAWNAFRQSLPLRPQSPMRFYWDLTATILIALMALTLPFRLAFVPSWSLEWEVVDLLTDVFFLVDIALNFVTAYVNDTGQHVTSFKLISIRYLRTWFVLDVIASVPVNWVIHGGIRFTPPPVGEAAANADTSQLFSYLRLVKLFKLLRLLRVAKLLRLLKQLEQRAVVALSLPSHTVIQVCKLLLTTFTFAHWNGCIQFYLATEFDSFVDVNGTLRAHPSSWPARAELGHRSSFEQWSWSYYHAVIQLLAIGEGVVPPRRLGEIWMFTISILLGAAMYATFVASLTSAIGELGIGSRKYRARLDTLGEYMRHARFPSDLREKLLQFYELNYPGTRTHRRTRHTAHTHCPLQPRPPHLVRMPSLRPRLHRYSKGAHTCV